MKKKTKIIACALAAATTLAIAGMGSGCAVKDWFEDKINGNQESVLIPELYACVNGNTVSSATIYDDADFAFEVKARDEANASALVEITAQPDGADASVEEAAGIWTFTPDLAGEYTITITSMAEESLTWTVTITVNEAPAIETVLNGEYQNVGKTEDDNLYVWFMYEEGIVLVTYEGEVYNYSTCSFETVKYCAGYNFTYDAATKAITLELAALTGLEEMYPGFVENENVLSSIKLGADYKMTVVYCNGDKQAKLEDYTE